MKQQVIPILPLRRIVIFPGQVTKLTLARKKSIATAEFAVKNGGQILLVPQLNPDAKVTKPTLYHNVGILASIFDAVHGNGIVDMYVTGHSRVIIKKVTTGQTHDTAEYEEVREIDSNPVQSDAYLERILTIIADKIALSDTSLRDAARGRH